ncbi:putative zinc finger, CCHC-type containing protein [Tanacetum coccineum]
MALVPKEGGSMSYQVSILTSTNYPVWAVKVKSIMDAYDLWGTVKPRALGEEPDARRVDWVRTTRLATLKREIEGLRMKESETVDDFATKLTGLASKVRGLGYELEEVKFMNRLLNSMLKLFLQIVASIEQCFELDSMLSDEVVGRLKTYEERIKGAEKIEDTQGGLLLVSERKSHGCKHCGNGGSNRDGFGRNRGRGRGSGKSRDGNERVRDKSHIKCYKCGEFGHYSNECLKWEKHEANLIGEELTLL